MSTNDPKKMAEAAKKQQSDNQAQHVLNALEAAGNALTLASIMIDRLDIKTQDEVDDLIAQIGK